MVLEHFFVISLGTEHNLFAETQKVKVFRSLIHVWMLDISSTVEFLILVLRIRIGNAELISINWIGPRSDTDLRCHHRLFTILSHWRCHWEFWGMSHVASVANHIFIAKLESLLVIKCILPLDKTIFNDKATDFKVQTNRSIFFCEMSQLSDYLFENNVYSSNIS